jgi:hypothetical protein
MCAMTFISHLKTVPPETFKCWMTTFQNLAQLPRYKVVTQIITHFQKPCNFMSTSVILILWRIHTTFLKFHVFLPIHVNDVLLPSIRNYDSFVHYPCVTIPKKFLTQSSRTTCSEWIPIILSSSLPYSSQHDSTNSSQQQIWLSTFTVTLLHNSLYRHKHGPATTTPTSMCNTWFTEAPNCRRNASIIKVLTSTTLRQEA